jgi:hypothetical protein
VKRQCLTLYVNGLGFRAIERCTGVSHNIQGATSAPKALCGKGFELPPSPGNLEQLTIKRTR